MNKWKLIQYNIARTMINLGFLLMPESRYKTEALELLWALRKKVRDEITQAQLGGKI